MKKVDDKILSVIEKHRMLSEYDTVIVAVSGGADSMCLLHFFNKISSKYNLNIICAHVNHGIRGAEADSDEKHVAEYCKNNNIKFRCAHFDVPAEAARSHESEEQCGRRLRYEFFDSVCPHAKIATAHNLNDCAETFIFNLARGTGLKGLTGIPPVRGNIIRPLISCTRAEIEEYLNYYQINYVTDSTNLLDEYSRNRIRHNVIPVLEDINNGFFKVFENSISVLAESEKYLSDVTDKAVSASRTASGFSVEYIVSLDDIIRNRVIKQICSIYNASDVSSVHISVINEFLENGGAVMLPGGVTIISDGKYLYKAAHKTEELKIYKPLDEIVGQFSFPGAVIGITLVDKSTISNYNISQLSKLGYADAEKLSSAVFRSRQNGDRFTFPGRGHSSSLKNLFKEYNITPESRNGVPFLADSENVLWINGIGVSEYAAVTEKTEKIVKITVM